MPGWRGKTNLRTSNVGWINYEGWIPGGGLAVVRQDVLPYSKLNRPTILLADDFAAFFAVLRRLLEPEFEVIGTVANGVALIDAAIRLTPDIVVSDIRMPILSGFEALRQLIAIQPRHVRSIQ